jgi:hypothetical protein
MKAVQLVIASNEVPYLQMMSGRKKRIVVKAIVFFYLFIEPWAAAKKALC